ncbi:MAG: NAD-dependent succinate-semialdehyde dehydrogenase [Bacteroidia bacterium]|nr:NAD-dependent succinate-semialdehyde dehydrogenase [Bacteroidia bacterium]
MNYRSVNPFTGEQYFTREFESSPGPGKSHLAFKAWREESVKTRITLFGNLAKKMEAELDHLSQLITREMGKPLQESTSEIQKCVSVIRYYINFGKNFLDPEPVKTTAGESFVAFEPLGVLLAIMPWNFPFWQVFRCAVPAILAGNVVLLKHAPNVPGCAEAMERLFAEAGFPPFVFKNTFLSNDQAATIIADPIIAGISFTGSDTTGAHIAGMAGSAIKKVVMELGGNDPFVVLDDADLQKAVDAAIVSRKINGGQACNGAKRFIVTPHICDRFTTMLFAAIRLLRVGNPLDPVTDIGPLARPDLADKVRHQVADTIAQGAVPHRGMEPPRSNTNFVQPVLLTNVLPGMRAFEEEVFGPVWPVIQARDEHHAIELANQSRFGLGASLWTKDKSKQKLLIPKIESGNVFVNDYVRSDPYLPFGGIKRSGYGRELSKWGIHEFLNIKTVYIK